MLGGILLSTVSFATALFTDWIYKLWPNCISQCP
jgi:hypothetical protein